MILKNTANFCENRNNHVKDTASKQSNDGPEDHYTVYKTPHLALTTFITCSARFSSVKFLSSRSDIEAVSTSTKYYITAHGLR